MSHPTSKLTVQQTKRVVRTICVAWAKRAVASRNERGSSRKEACESDNPAQKASKMPTRHTVRGYAQAGNKSNSRDQITYVKQLIEIDQSAQTPSCVFLLRAMQFCFLIHEAIKLVSDGRLLQVTGQRAKKGTQCTTGGRKTASRCVSHEDLGTNL